MVDHPFISLAGKALILFVRIYQACLSPFFGPCCRFYPSCSDYMIAAIQRHGPLKGSFCGLRRICRCHPWNPGGYDPVR